MPKLQIVILGAAAGGGFPQWNCNSDACNKARMGQATALTQSSIAVSADDEHWLLCNASPDLRQQILQTPVLQPKNGLRHSPIAAVILTNADVDHIAGLLTLRESSPLAILGTGRVLSTLKANSIFDVLNPEFVDRQALVLDEPFEVLTRGGSATGLLVEAFAVPGKVALYLEKPKAGPDLGTEAGDTIGLRISALATGAHFFYVPGCAALPSKLAGRLKGASLVLFDGTLWRDDEMIKMGVGVKTGQRMGHMSMFGEQGTIAAFRHLDVNRKIFVHVNNTNPALLDGSSERNELELAGWEVAFDGMQISL